MPKVECGDCGGNGKAVGQDGTLHFCTNCGGEGFHQVSKSEVEECGYCGTELPEERLVEIGDEELDEDFICSSCNDRGRGENPE